MARKLVVELIGDSRNLERNLGRATGATKGFEVSLKNLARTVGLVFGAATVVHGLEDIIKTAEAAETATKKMGVAFKNTGLNVKAYTQQIEEAKASGRSLGFTNVETTNSMARLITATGNVKQATKAMGEAQDFARFKNIDLNASTQVVTSAMAGNLRAIKQLGIAYIPTATAVDALKAAHKASKTEISANEMAMAKLADKQRNGVAVLELLNQKIHGQADAYSKTTSGAMARFRAALDDLEEKIGAKLLPTMTRWANYLTDHLPQIEKFLQNVADKAQTLWGVLKKVVDATGGWQTALGTLLALKFASVITGWLVPLTGAGGMLPTLTKLNRTKWMVTIGISVIGGELLAQLQHKIDALTGTVDTTSSAPSSTGAGPMEKTQPPGTKLYRNTKTGAIIAVSANGKKLWVWSGKKWVGYAQFKSFDPDHPPAELKPYYGSGVASGGGKAGAKRGIGGAGSVFQAPMPGGAQSGGGGHDPSQSFLGGTPAGGTEHDWMASAGTTVLAPEAGVCYAHGGHAPSTGIHPGNVFGWSLFFYGDSGTIYAGTHLAKVYPGRKQSGDPIGVIGGTKGWASHLHWETKGGGTTKSPPVFGPAGGKVSGGGGGGSRGGGAKPTPAPPIFSIIGKQIAGDVDSATTHVATSLDKLMKMIIKKQADLAAAIARMRTAVASAFQNFASQALSAFDAINNAWKSPSAQKLQKMQAEDTAKAAARAYADAVEQYGVNSPEAAAAARAWEESQLEAQAQAEQEAHEKKVKADRDAFQKRLAELQKEASGATTRAKAKKIQQEIQALFAEYGITQDSLQAATDWQTAQSLFVGAIGDLKKSLDALTAALDKSPRPSPGTSNPGASTPGPGLASGGFLGGVDGQPIPILAHGGEYVIRKKAVDRLGVGFLNRLNRYQDGGVVHPWQLDDAYMDPGYRDKLMEAERQANLKYGGASIFNPRNWTPDIVNTAGKYHDMLEHRYGEAIHFEDGWIPEIYNAVQKSAGIIESALASPPDNIWNRTHGTVWYDLGQGRGRKPAIPERLGKFGGHPNVGWGSGLTPSRLEDIVSGYVPSFAMGGVMPRTGLAYLHQGETISPAGQGGIRDIHVFVGDKEVAAIVQDKIVERGSRGGPLTARTP
jgi:hypothetical protein